MTTDQSASGPAHHVVSEGLSVPVHQRQQLLRGEVQGGDGGAHQRVQLLKLLVTKGELTHHRSQGRPLGV